MIHSRRLHKFSTCDLCLAVIQTQHFLVGRGLTIAQKQRRPSLHPGACARSMDSAGPLDGRATLRFLRSLGAPDHRTLNGRAQGAPVHTAHTACCWFSFLGSGPVKNPSGSACGACEQPRPRVRRVLAWLNAGAVVAPARSTGGSGRLGPKTRSLHRPGPAAWENSIALTSLPTTLDETC